MPGLNETGTDIADDMAYGYGFKSARPVYTTEELQAYKNSMRTTVLTNRSTLFFQCKGFRTAGTGNRWRTAKGRGER